MSAGDIGAFAALLSSDASGSEGARSKHPARPDTKTATQPTTTDVSSSGDIWSEEETAVTATDADVDPRPAPEYELTHRQKVSSEDMYLGMTGKLNSFGHSDEIVVRVKLPGTTSAREIESDVVNGMLDVRCPNYRLRLQLPVPVNDSNGSARFDAAAQTLSIVLPVDLGDILASHAS